MRKLLPLAVLAVAVLAGLVALIVSLRGDPGAGEAAAPSPPAATGKVRDHRGERGGGGRLAGRPSLPRTGASSPTVAARDGQATRVDHRGDDSPVADKPKYKIAPTVVGQVRLAIRPLIKRCTEAHKDELGSAGARLQTVIRAHVEAEQLTIAELELQTRDLPDDGALVECVRRGLDGFTLAVAGQPDVAIHPLTYPFDLPLP